MALILFSMIGLQLHLRLSVGIILVFSPRLFQKTALLARELALIPLLSIVLGVQTIKDRFHRFFLMF